MCACRFADLLRMRLSGSASLQRLPHDAAAISRMDCGIKVAVEHDDRYAVRGRHAVERFDVGAVAHCLHGA